MMFIGLTGGVGSGKSAILQYLKDNYKCIVLQADEIARELMEPGGACYEKIAELVGPKGGIKEDGFLDRPSVAKLMFEDDDLRATINGMVHPAVKKCVLEIVERERNRDRVDFVFLEAALLLDDHYDEVCDEIWYIYASEEEREKRLISSRGYSKEKIKSIFESQLKEEIFREKCDEVINNNGAKEEAYKDIDRIMKIRLGDLD